MGPGIHVLLTMRWLTDRRGTTSRPVLGPVQGEGLIAMLSNTVPQLQAQAQPCADSTDDAALAPIQWTDAYAMGDAGIDAEHRNFVDIVNRLNAAIRDREPGAVIAVICDELVADAASHFRSEEAAMERAGFGALSGHRREHERLLKFLEKQSAQARAGGDHPVLVDAALAIKDALLGHMFRVDVHYKSHFMESNGR